MSVWISLVVLLFVGVTVQGARRILGLWQRTGQLPELLVAVVMLGVGAFGVGLSYFVTLLVPVGPLQTVLGFVPMIGVHIGVGALWAFTWRVYYPDRPVARGVVWGAWALLAGLLLYAAAVGTTAVLQQPPMQWLASSVYAGAMAWSAVESFRYWGAMRKRQRLGLADPLTTNRFLLWGVATGCAAVGTSGGAIAQNVLTTAPGEANPWIMLCYAGFGLTAAVAFWLAFLPPSAYRDHILRGSGAA